MVIRYRHQCSALENEKAALQAKVSALENQVWFRILLTRLFSSGSYSFVSRRY